VIGGVVVDATALSDLAQGISPCATEYVDVALGVVDAIGIPAGALAECWAQVPEKAQAFLAMFTGLPIVVVKALDETDAIDAGAAAAEAGQTGATVGLMHAVLIASSRGWPLLTADSAAARALNPKVMVEQLP
jgi:PIN domain nuclease of toxin-antitoxin system